VVARRRRDRRQYARDGHAADGFEYVPGSATVDGIKVTDAKDQVIGAGEPWSASTDGCSSRASASCPRARCARPLRNALDAGRGRRAHGAGTAHVRFAVEVGLSAPQAIESQLSRGAARYGRSQFTFTPRFDVLKTELAPPTKPRCARSSTPGAARATSASAPSATPIRSRSRRQPPGVRRQLRAVEARAQTVANYLAAR
jgi:hypothetical protein